MVDKIRGPEFEYGYKGRVGRNEGRCIMCRGASSRTRLCGCRVQRPSERVCDSLKVAMHA